MAIFPDREPDLKKEEVLSRSPFTRAFIDVTLAEDLDAWTAALTSTREPLQDEVESRFGNHWESTHVLPLMILADKFRIYDPVLNDHADLRISLVENMFLVGFETGGDWGIFLEDVAAQLTLNDIFNSALTSTTEGALELTNVVSTIMETGGFLRRLSDSKGDGNTLDVFRMFINDMPESENPSPS